MAATGEGFPSPSRNQFVENERPRREPEHFRMLTVACYRPSFYGMPALSANTPQQDWEIECRNRIGGTLAINVLPRV